MGVVEARIWRIIVPLYLVASGVVAFFGPSLFEAVGALRLPLGPLAYLASAFPGAERRAAFPGYPVVYERAIIWYAIWSILLGLCVALTLRKTMAARVAGFFLIVLTWIGSAALVGVMME